MKNYKAIIFDLFGTVVHFDESLLPAFKFQEELFHCTTPPLFEMASRVQNDFSIECFHQALQEIIIRLRKEKTISLKEISCLTRMKALLDHLHFPENEETQGLAFRMKEVHMSWMKRCVYLPDGYRPLLEKLASFRLGLLSNFDDTGTGYQILEELKIDQFFHAILFSEEAGLIKPHSDLFTRILTRLNFAPAEVLFVGDTPEADILGPKRIGMDTVWINPGEYSFPEEIPRPDYEIKNIADLEAIIQI
jgi:HAD superfamily hydrolase (TIGR01509 family)